MFDLICQEKIVIGIVVAESSKTLQIVKKWRKTNNFLKTRSNPHGQCDQIMDMYLF